MKCKLSLLLTSFALCIILAFAPTLTSKAAVGVGTWWDGIVTVGNTSQINSFYVTDVELVGQNYNAVYKGDFNTYLDVECYDTDVFINGYLRKRVNLTFSDNGLGYISAPQVYCEPVIMDGITASVAMVGSQDFSVSFDIMLSFNNYYVSQNSFRIPLLISVVSSEQFTAGSDWGSVVRLYSNLTQVEDWSGDMWQYDNLEDVPSVDGYLSQQNQTIINQSQTQNNLSTEQNTLIQNQTSQQHEDSQAQINQSITNTQNQINQSIDNTETMVNGFDTTDSDKTSASLESDFSSLENAEADSIDFAQTALRGFSIPAGGIQGLAEGMTASMSLVTSMAQAIFEASEAFGTIIVAVFALIIVSMVIGLAKFMR